MDKEAQEKIVEFITPLEMVGHLGDEPILKANLESFANRLLELMEKLGYRKLPQDKPPLLSNEEMAEKLHITPQTKLKFESKLTPKDVEAFKDEMKIELRAIAQAQREADIKYYEGK